MTVDAGNPVYASQLGWVEDSVFRLEGEERAAYAPPDVAAESAKSPHTKAATQQNLSQQKKLASALRDEHGERISQEQQQAVVRAMQALEEQQELAFERRDLIGQRISKLGRKLGDTKERLTAVENENAQIELQAEGIKQEIATMKEEREHNLRELEAMRGENEEIKSRTLMALDLRMHKLRHEIKDVDRALKNAIWSAGSSESSTFVSVGVGADTPLPPLPPVEPIVLAPVRRRDDESQTGVVAPRKGGAGRPQTSSAAQSFGIRKYGMMASMSLKDVGEIAHKHAKPVDLLQAHSIGTRGDALLATLLGHDADAHFGSGRSLATSISSPYLRSLSHSRSLPSCGSAARSRSRTRPRASSTRGSPPRGVVKDSVLIFSFLISLGRVLLSHSADGAGRGQGLPRPAGLPHER